MCTLRARRLLSGQEIELLKPKCFVKYIKRNQTIVMANNGQLVWTSLTSFFAHLVLNFSSEFTFSLVEEQVVIPLVSVSVEPSVSCLGNPLKIATGF